VRICENRAVEAQAKFAQRSCKRLLRMTEKSQLTADNVEKLGQMLGPETTLEEKMRAYQQAGFNIYYMDNSQGERERERECERFRESGGQRVHRYTWRWVCICICFGGCQGKTASTSS
jgi:hypothetical protein